MDAPQSTYLDVFLAVKLAECVASNDLEGVNCFLSMGANPNRTNLGSSSPLKLAVSKGFTDIARVLIQAGANVKETNFLGSTLLMEAVYYHDDLEIINLLIQHGVKVDAVDGYKMTALMIANQNFRKNSPYRLMCELSAEQLMEVAESKSQFSGKVAHFYEMLEKNKMKVCKIIMPFLLKMDSNHGFNQLPSEIFDMICDLLSKFKDIDGFDEWYKHRVESDAKEICKLAGLSLYANKNAKDSAKLLTDAPAPVVTLLQNAKKRKAEDELDEEGRNKRQRVENQDKQEQDMNLESKHFSFGGD